MPVAPFFRLARSAAFAVVSLGLGAVAHVFGGGTVPMPSAAGGLMLAFAAAFAVTGRERGLRTILPLLAGTQGALHLLFAAVGPDGVADTAWHPHSGLMPGLAMLITHAWAIGLTALWLARGEAGLWSLLRRLGARLAPLPTGEPTPSLTRRPAPVHRDEPAPRRSLLLRHAVSRRGPPAPRVLPTS